MLEFRSDLVHRYRGKDGQDISHFIRGFIVALEMVLGIKDTFSNYDKIKESVELAKKGVV